MLIDGKEISKLVYKDIVNEINIITKKIQRPPSLNIILLDCLVCVFIVQVLYYVKKC